MFNEREHCGLHLIFKVGMQTFVRAVLEAGIISLVEVNLGGWSQRLSISLLNKLTVED